MMLTEHSQRKRHRPEEQAFGTADSAGASAQLALTVPTDDSASEKMTADTAEQIATEEGLTLVRSNRTSSGFRCVKISAARAESKPYQLVYLGKAHGRYGSAAEAALAFARLLGQAGSAQAAEEAAREPMSLEEVQKAVAAEGLTLVPSDLHLNPTGFAGVSRKRERASTSSDSDTCTALETVTSGNTGFYARTSNGRYIGYAATAAEAALLYARHLGPEASADAATVEKLRSTEQMTPEQAEAQAAVEGLTLVRNIRNRTGFAGVSFTGSSGKVSVTCRGKWITGRCLTPEEGALIYARHLGPAESKAEAEAADAVLPTVEEVEQLAAAEGLTLVLSSRTEHGFKYAYRDRGAFRVKYDHKYLGAASTPAQAALLLARKLGSDGSAQAVRAEAAEPMTEEEAERLAAEEGLTLVHSTQLRTSPRAS